MKEWVNLHALLATVIYSVVGSAVLVLMFWIVDLIVPQSLWKEITEKQNKAFAILAAAFVLALAIIIASAIHE